MPEAQDYKSHTRFVPMYHVGVALPLLVNFLWSAYKLFHIGINGDTIVGLLVAIALVLLFLSARMQILTVQDRVIRLEMRTRLARLLPADLQNQIATLSVPQLVALRFASDGELADLTRDVLAGKLATQKEIKMRVKNWQADFQRA